LLGTTESYQYQLGAEYHWIDKIDFNSGARLKSFTPQVRAIAFPLFKNEFSSCQVYFIVKDIQNDKLY